MGVGGRQVQPCRRRGALGRRSCSSTRSAPVPCAPATRSGDRLLVLVCPITRGAEEAFWQRHHSWVEALPGGLLAPCHSRTRPPTTHTHPPPPTPAPHHPLT